MNEHVGNGRGQLGSPLVTGGSGFVYRHTVAELRDPGYDVATISRDRHGFQFGDEVSVERPTVDRPDEEAPSDVAERVEPDAVVDGAAFYPGDDRTATGVFADTRWAADVRYSQARTVHGSTATVAACDHERTVRLFSALLTSSGGRPAGSTGLHTQPRRSLARHRYGRVEEPR